MIRGRYYLSGDAQPDIFALRREVFLDELGLPDMAEVDEFDRMAVYALVSDEEGVPGATGRLFIDGDSHFRIGAIAVRSAVRGQGYGDLVIRMLLSRALELNAPSVYVLSLGRARGFYARYGFRPVASPDGDQPTLMCVGAEDINFSGSCQSGACSACGKCAPQAHQSQSPSS